MQYVKHIGITKNKYLKKTKKNIYINNEKRPIREYQITI